MIVDCQILCIDRKAAENGLPAEELWMDFCFDILNVEALKVDTMPDTLEPNPANSVLFMKNGTTAIVNIPYRKLRETWATAYNTEKLLFKTIRN